MAKIPWYADAMPYIAVRDEGGASQLKVVGTMATLSAVLALLLRRPTDPDEIWVVRLEDRSREWTGEQVVALCRDPSRPRPLDHSRVV